MFDRRRILLKIYKLFDLLVMVFSFALATWMTYYQTGLNNFDDFFSMRIKVQNFALFLGLVFAWHFVFSALGLYSSKRLSKRYKDVVDILKATVLATVALYLAALLFRMVMITPMFLLILWVSSSAICVFSRIAMWRILKWIRLRGRNLRFLLIVGTNSRALRFAKKLHSRPELGYRIVGFVENDWIGNGVFRSNGYKVVSDFNSFPSFIRENVVDEVLICLPVKTFYDTIQRIVALSEEQGITARYLTDMFKIKKARSRGEFFEGEPLLSHYNGVMGERQVVVKRIMDIALSTVLLLMSFPLFAATACLIKLTTKGPVFFVQERIGLNKRRFSLIKFRTMVKDADQRQADFESFNEMTGPVFKIKKDPRITPIGKILRKASIDELPQLINVFRGEMSMVGPRPLPVRDFEGFDQSWHRRRFSIRPGITCLWQVNGRSSIPFEKWMQLDMEYIDTWSMWLDIKILAKTVPAVLQGSGAE